MEARSNTTDPPPREYYRVCASTMHRSKIRVQFRIFTVIIVLFGKASRG